MAERALRRVAVAGAGLSGAVLARRLAEASIDVVLFDKRDHVAGNCYTRRDTSGVLVHQFGPHLFHTDNQRVWEYLGRFADFEPYEHRAKARTSRGVFSFPVNLLTINALWGQAFAPAEAEEFIRSRCDAVDEPANFEEQALASVGRELYEVFFKGYTIKQWGRDPRDLPASVARRLPVRFTYDDRYFNDRYQALPRNGYTAMIEQMLDHPRIRLELGSPVDASLGGEYDHLVWTGPLDAFFGHVEGRLPYRTLRFDTKRVGGDHQGAAIINYCDRDVPFTRVVEHKHFAPWERHEESVVTTEYSAEAGPEDEPFYPVRFAGGGAGNELLSAYEELARAQAGVSFLGRLGTFRYLDMDTTVGEALLAADEMLEASADRRRAPAFFSRLKP